MGGNSFGKHFSVTTFGESHGPAIGCVIDGCPAGIPITTERINQELARRRPGVGAASTTRSEMDKAEILSGVFEGLTLGTPIAIVIRNTNAKSSDYTALRDVYRPGHADWCWEAKFGRRDHNGGGRSSARETAGRVAAGAVARIFLESRGVNILAWTAELDGIAAPPFESADFNTSEIERNSLRAPSSESARAMEARIENLRSEGDSAGGIVACRIEGIPAGLGDPVFSKLDAELAKAMLSIGAAKGIEFGSGFAAARLHGSQNNDIPEAVDLEEASLPFNTVPAVRWKTNNAGGMLGGISTGMPLEFRVVFKPVPSIRKEQQTINRNGESVPLSIGGRHDVCVCPRAVPVVEAMAAITVADFFFS